MMLLHPARFVNAGLLVLLLAACAPPPRQGAFPAAEPATPGPTTTVDMPVHRETGTASWYGREFQGRATASGANFDPEKLSAAHRTLPFGTVVTVRNLENGRTVEVVVNDRGPFLKDRVLTLSIGAARELGFVGQGTAQVLIESLAPVPEGGTWTVLAASFAEEENAKVLKYRLSQRYEVVSIIPAVNAIGTFFRVLVGNYPSEEKAERIAAKLLLDGLEPVVLRRD